MSSSTLSPLTDSPRPSVAPQALSYRELHALTHDLHRPSALIYWVDFLATMTVAWASSIAMATASLWITQSSAFRFVVQGVAFLVSVVAWYRGSTFIHELMHLPPRGFRAFRLAWNVLCGFVMLMPSFLYYIHQDHHRRKHYGTRADGEYIAVEYRPRWLIWMFVLQSAVIPFLSVLRFLILSPLCWIFPQVRFRIHRRGSSLAMDPFYMRSEASPHVMRIIILQEVCCFAYLMAAIYLLSQLPTAWALAIVVQYAVTIATIAYVNALRTLVSHRWENDESEMDAVEQLLDSVNFSEGWFPELWAPLGMRYHAAHHLFPAMPYHNLGTAHRRLMAHLPADSPYRKTIRTNFWGTVCDVLGRAGIRHHH